MMNEREQRAVRYLEWMRQEAYPGILLGPMGDHLIRIEQILQGCNDMPTPPEVGASGDGPAPETTATKGEVATANGRIDELKNHVGNLERRIERIEAEKPPNETQYVKLKVKVDELMSWARLAPWKE